MGWCEWVRLRERGGCSGGMRRSANVGCGVESAAVWVASRARRLDFAASFVLESLKSGGQHCGRSMVAYSEHVLAKVVLEIASICNGY